MPVFDNYLNTVEAAEMLGFHYGTVERMCREGRIPAKKSNNMWLIDKSEPEKYLVYCDLKTRRIRELGQKLKSTRHQLGLSQPQLAVTLGVSNTAISRWEHDNRIPRAKHSRKILRWLEHVGQ